VTSLDPERSISQKNRALAGIIGPATFALTIVVLTLVRYDFIVGLVWHPTHRLRRAVAERAALFGSSPLRLSSLIPEARLA